MDRLPTLIAVVLLVGCFVGCKDDKPVEPTSRTNAAKVAPKKTDTAAFCDKKHATETAPAFTVPALAGNATLPASTKWRWINVWATWCKPCIEEMPRLRQWQTKASFDLQFVSVDEADADIDAYRKLHPETPETVRLAKPDAQGAWFTQLGIDAGAPIPVHVFVDPSGRVRCVRAGGVREQDFAMVEALFAGK